MGRPRIFINTSIYPDDVIETLARIFYDDLINDLNSEEEKLLKYNAGIYNMNDIFNEGNEHKEHADEEIQRDHFHLYLDSEKQLQITQKYFDIPLPEPCFVFIRPNGTRTYKFFNDLASAYGIENIHDPTMPAKIDDYIQKELKEEGIVYEILSVCHPNIQLKKQYGDKYFMLRYVVKQHLVARANFDVDEELAYLQENCEKLCEKANQLIL